MLNYTQIRNECPMAWEAWGEYCYYNKVYDVKPSDLYSFFDSKGIICVVEPNYGAIKNWLAYVAHYVDIEDMCWKEVDWRDKDFEDRPSAETAAFMEAFSILEKQLKG